MADDKKGLGRMIKDWFRGGKGQGGQGKGDGSGRREGYGKRQDGTGPQGGTEKCPESSTGKRDEKSEPQESDNINKELKK